MARKHFLSQKQLEVILNQSSDEEDVDHADQGRIVLNENTTIIYVPPAKVDDISDEECIDEEDLVTDVPPNLEIAGEITIEYDSNVCDFAAPTLQTEALPKSGLITSSPAYTSLINFGEPSWKKSKRPNFNFDEPDEDCVMPLQAKIVETMSGKSPLELFWQYFDTDVMDILVKSTNLYAHQHNVVLEVSKEEMFRFLGIQIFSGYHTLPQLQLYWSVKPDFGIPIVKQAMSRHKFTTIKKVFHLMDNNNIDTTDRFAKVRPLLDILNVKYKQFGIFTTHLSIDEQMIPYFGRHNCKMFIRGKPIRFGFRYWCLCSDTGYLYEAVPYAGIATPYNKQIGLGASVVLNLLRSVTYPDRHVVYFDNFFTSYYLFCLLNERKFRAIGTARSNRLRGADLHLGTAKKRNPVNKPGKKLQSPQYLDKNEYDYVFDRNNKLFIARWHDNNEVTKVSNFVGAQPEVPTTRYSSVEKKKVSLPQPKIISEYNKHMGGVDLHDNGVANYRIAIRGKKWWWPLWNNCINSSKCLENSLPDCES